ncbi:MAG: hypothetical protein WBY44_25410 [Bryobacteraceae bacterium]
MSDQSMPKGAEHTVLSVGVSPMEDRVVLCVGAERVALSAFQATHYATMIAEASQQVMDAANREQPTQ